MADLQLFGQFGMGMNVARLAMHGNRDAGADPVIHLDQFRLSRVARDMNIGILFGNHFYAARHQLVDQPSDWELIAGNHLGREQHRITGA